MVIEEVYAEVIMCPHVNKFVKGFVFVLEAVVFLFEPFPFLDKFANLFSFVFLPFFFIVSHAYNEFFECSVFEGILFRVFF